MSSPKGLPPVGDSPNIQQDFSARSSVQPSGIPAKEKLGGIWCVTSGVRAKMASVKGAVVSFVSPLFSRCIRQPQTERNLEKGDLTQGEQVKVNDSIDPVAGSIISTAPTVPPQQKATVSNIAKIPLEKENVASPPKSELLESLQEIAKAEGQGLVTMEALWSEPALALAFSDEELEEALNKYHQNFAESPQEIMERIQSGDMTVEEYMTQIYPKLGCGSCGNTANVLEDLVSPGGMYEQSETKKLDHLTLVDELRKQEIADPHGNWFCRVNCGGHSFLTEYNDGKYLIHQSYWGKYTLAENENRILTNPESSTFNPSRFRKLLEVAISPDPELYSPTPEQKQARLALFSAESLHPQKDDTDAFRFIPHSLTKEQISTKLQQVNHNGEIHDAWREIWHQPMKNQLRVKGEASHTVSNRITYDSHSFRDNTIWTSDWEAISSVEAFDRFSIGSWFNTKRFPGKIMRLIEKTSDNQYTFSLHNTVSMERQGPDSIENLLREKAIRAMDGKPIENLEALDRYVVEDLPYADLPRFMIHYEGQDREFILTDKDDGTFTFETLHFEKEEATPDLRPPIQVE